MSQGKLDFLPPVDERLIISLYDYTGEWANPYIEAGYPVMLWDKKIEGDLLNEIGCTSKEFENKIMGLEQYVYGIIAAPPCDDFAGSGARWCASEKTKQILKEYSDLFGWQS